MKKNEKINKVNEPWSDYLSLGIRSVDMQHKRFFMMLDDLRKNFTESQKTGDIINEDLKNQMLSDLEDYTVYHFRTEENLMHDSNYPDIEIHIQQHNLFIKKLAEFRTAYKFQSQVLMEQMIGFLGKWFLVHISDYDKKYVEHIKQRDTSKLN